jgi:hypothetical protein
MALLIAGLQASAQRPFTCEDQFFLTLSTEPPSLNEVVIDPVSQATVFQSINNDLGINVNAAGFRSTDNYIYCIDPENQTLVRLDADGTAVVLASLPLNPLHAYFAGDITPDGRYLVLIGSATLVNGQIIAGDLVEVDLEDPNFGLSIRQLNQPAIVYDIAFHPVTGVLYGYDSFSQRVVQINRTNGAFSYPYPSSGLPFITGSLFFDAYANLYAYGSTSVGSEQNSFYRIDLGTGASRLLTTGAVATASDGCSCPYTIELSKSVLPKETLPCSDVEYTFRIVNTTARPQMGITLEDRLPPGFQFVSVKSNPLGGNVLSMPGDAVFRLEDIDLMEGVFDVVIVVNTGNAPAGIYRNQAMLFNLPQALGADRRSDDRSTLVLDDSTELRIIALPFDTVLSSATICEGVPFVRLNAGIYAGLVPGQLRYNWSDGSSAAALDVTEPGDYQVQLVAGCDTATVFYTVGASSIEVEILTEDDQQINLGDSLLLESRTLNSSAQTFYQWQDPQGGSLGCPDCPDTWARPFNDIRYGLLVENELGCRDSAFIRIRVIKNRDVYFPNVFRPGSENEGNAFFYGSGDQFALIARFSVFSRWGELLYEARNISFNDLQAGWDGSFRGREMLPGVYAWTARVEYLDGAVQEFAGDVTLVR